MRGLWAQVRRDQRLFNVVERRRIERGAAGEARQIVGDLLRSFCKPATQAVEPAHARTPTRQSRSEPVTRTLTISPRSAPSTCTGAKLSAWPLAPPSIITRCVVPSRPLSQLARR